MTYRTPNYVTSEDHSYWDNGASASGPNMLWTPNSIHTLPAGTFARPIEVPYLPSHIEVSPNFDPKVEVYCYTRMGILKLPRSILREV